MHATIEEEMMDLEANHTWNIMSIPNDKQPIRCRWVFIMKVNLNGVITLLKAWLVDRQDFFPPSSNFFFRSLV